MISANILLIVAVLRKFAYPKSSKPSTPRERVLNALHYKSVDKVPLEYLCTPVGFYEHGEKLNELYASLPGDFAPFRRTEIPKLDASDFDENGNYHAFKRDNWGVVWEHRIFGIAGIPYDRPIKTPEQVKELVRREFETFKMYDGGSWFYVEVDNGFPFENIEALIEAI